jgi:hypothetical protein
MGRRNLGSAIGAVVLFAGATACQGIVGDSEQGPGARRRPDDGSAGGPAGPAGAVAADGGLLAGDGGLSGATDPGHVTLRRLNRTEYANTVEDLFGVRPKAASELPSDDIGYGFDNIGDVLSVSPLLVEMYQNAAEEVAQTVLFQPIDEPATQHAEAEVVGSDVGAVEGDAWNLYSNGSVTAPVTIAADGQHEILVRAWCQQAAGQACQMAIEADGLPAQTVTVDVDANAPAVYTVMADFKAGMRTIGAGFLNDFYDSMTTEDRNLYVDWLEVRGPLGVSGAANPLREQLLTCDPEADGHAACARETLAALLPRAWRRPVANAEIDELMRLFDVGEQDAPDFDTGMALVLQGVLLSPHFLFRVELDANPESTVAHPVTPHELASRLSYFLWSTMPDDALRGLADDGTLVDPAVVEAQVRRMLKDDRADALIANFASQWLYLRALDEHEAEYNLFPEFGPAMKAAMRKETELMFAEVLAGNLGFDELLTADYTFVDDVLAMHYGVASPASGFEKVSLAGTNRAGLLGHASLLSVTSYPARTSPVRRGKFVLEQLLCTPPMPPPPGVEGLVEEEMPTGSLRERMEAHRKNPVCASCHLHMDPIGFALEGFGPIGTWRTEDEHGFAIESASELPDGTMVSGAEDLAQAIRADARYPRCVAEKLFTYALGRGPVDTDAGYLDAIAAQLVASGYGFEDLVLAIAASEAFLQRRGEAPGEVGP